MSEIRGPADVWAIIERAEASYAALERELEALDAEGLQRFYGLVAVLSDDALIDDELHYEAADLYLSEDGMEAFGWWVITQGLAFFDALTSETLPLQDALAMHMEGKPQRRWESGGDRRYEDTNFLRLARAVHEARFGPWDDSYERECELRAKAYELRDAELGI